MKRLGWVTWIGDAGEILLCLRRVTRCQVAAVPFSPVKGKPGTAFDSLGLRLTGQSPLPVAPAAEVGVQGFVQDLPPSVRTRGVRNPNSSEPVGMQRLTCVAPAVPSSCHSGQHRCPWKPCRFTFGIPELPPGRNCDCRRLSPRPKRQMTPLPVCLPSLQGMCPSCSPRTYEPWLPSQTPRYHIYLLLVSGMKARAFQTCSRPR